MRVLFLSSGRRAKEITKALRNKNVKIKTLINPRWYQLIPHLFSRYDIIHADNARHHGVMAVLLAKLKKKKSTCIIRGCGVHTQKNKRFNAVLEMLIVLAERICFKHLNHIFFISKNVEETFKQNFNISVPTSIAYNGAIIPENIPKIDIRNKIKTEFNKDIKKNDPVLITVTNLKIEEKAQGIEVLKEAMRSLPKNVWLLVLGSGKYLQKVKEKHPKNVIFLGFQEAYPWLADADLFVYCSFLESFGQVIVEAQAVGLPIVASNTCGIPETTKYAKLCEPKPEEFIKAIRPLIKSKQMREEQARLNKNWIKKRDWNWAIEKYIKTWRMLRK